MQEENAKCEEELIHNEKLIKSYTTLIENKTTTITELKRQIEEIKESAKQEKLEYKLAEGRFMNKITHLEQSKIELIKKLNVTQSTNSIRWKSISSK